MIQNGAEVLRRLDLAATRIMLFGSLAGAVLWLVQFYLLDGGPLLELAVLIMLPLLLGGVLRVLAWILKGFASPTGRPAHPE